MPLWVVYLGTVSSQACLVSKQKIIGKPRLFFSNQFPFSPPQAQCYYQGYIKGYPGSVATLSTCSGLRYSFSPSRAVIFGLSECIPPPFMRSWGRFLTDCSVMTFLQTGSQWSRIPLPLTLQYCRLFKDLLFFLFGFLSKPR